MIEQSDVEQQREIKMKSIRLLSRREYSYKELELRFKNDYVDSNIDCALQALVNDGYQSDTRFVESFVRYRIGQGQGLNKIRFELKGKGIDSQLLLEAVDVLDPDWYQLAVEVAERKFGGSDLSERKQQAKLMRFIMQRGFSPDQGQCAMESIIQSQKVTRD